MRWGAWAAPLMLSALAVVACGGNSTTSDNAAATPNAAAPNAAPSGAIVHIPANFCALLSAADIGQVMGQPHPAPTRDNSDVSGLTCDSASDVSFMLIVGSWCSSGQPAVGQCTDMQSQTFTTTKQGLAEPLQNIPGLGDQAYCFTTTNPVATLVFVDVLKGWINIQVGADTCAHAQTLAGMLLPKLGG